jgi:hypothetical protein
MKNDAGQAQAGPRLGRQLDSIGLTAQSRVMASILPFIKKETVFDDATTRLMGEAFDEVCKSLRDKGQPEVVYEVIARRIIEAAKKGERDPQRLRAAGTIGLQEG